MEVQTGELRPDVSRDLMYLSNKRTLLSNPGTKLDDIYYNQLNTQVSLSECTWNNGRLQIALSSVAFGGQSQVVIPNQSLLNETFLHLELPPLAANQTIVRGWGYQCIQSIRN